MGLENILVVFGYLSKYLSTLLSFMKAAEETKETGEVKKSIVTGLMKTVIHSIAQESTGGAKESWNQLENPISLAIDAIATAVFGSRDTLKFRDDDPANAGG